MADQSFSLNHPKIYLAYPLAAAHPDDTETLMEIYVVGEVDSARMGAEFLGLIDETPSSEAELTSLDRELLRYAVELEGDRNASIELFGKRSTERFVDIAGEGALTRWVVYSYPATELLVDGLLRLHDEAFCEPTLRQVVLELFDTHPTFTVELFIRGTDEARERIFADKESLDPEALVFGEIYTAPTTFQLKAMMFQARILTDRGIEPDKIDPTNDIWALSRLIKIKY